MKGYERHCDDSVAEARRCVEHHYTKLYEHAKALDSRCQDVTGILMSGDAVHDAKIVAKLTLLAFLFVLLSFTTSFFGMNFKELENQSIWKWCAMTVPIMLILILILSVDVVRHWDACVDALKRYRERHAER